MVSPRRRALALAAVQAADLAVTTVSSKYGDEHLDHLRVPHAVRPVLPVVKVAAIGALLATSRHPSARSVVGAGLAVYYASALAFHLRAGDSLGQLAPAAMCGALAASLVSRPC